MKRDLKRVLRAHGIKMFAVPVVVVLLLAVVADQRLDGYLERRQEAAQLLMQLESSREVLALNGKIERRHQELTPEYSTLLPLLHSDPQVSLSMQAMQEQLRQLLQSLYFSDVEFFDATDTAQGHYSRLVIGARFHGVPQQLPRLQAALAQAPKLVVMDQLEVRVVADPVRSGQQLAVTARFVGLHMQPSSEVAAAKASSKLETRP